MYTNDRMKNLPSHYFIKIMLFEATLKTQALNMCVVMEGIFRSS